MNSVIPTGAERSERSGEPALSELRVHTRGSRMGTCCSPNSTCAACISIFRVFLGQHNGSSSDFSGYFSGPLQPVSDRAARGAGVIYASLKGELVAGPVRQSDYSK